MKFFASVCALSAVAFATLEPNKVEERQINDPNIPYVVNEPVQSCNNMLITPLFTESLSRWYSSLHCPPLSSRSPSQTKQPPHPQSHLYVATTLLTRSVLTRTPGIRLRHSTLMVPSPPHQRPDLPPTRLRPSRRNSRTKRHRLTHQHHRRSLRTDDRQRDKRQRHPARRSHHYTQRHCLCQRHRRIHTRQQRHACRCNRKCYYGWRSQWNCRQWNYGRCCWWC